MNDFAIRVENLGKEYRIGQPLRYKALRDTLTDAIYSPFRRLASLAHRASLSNSIKNDAYIWALRNVSFEIRHGEVIGIIGRNGAGKSTLLKILSRITEPTEGQAKIRGRVGSLLEVGTGFHPELTGRENIYLNGAILGMSRREIERKFDDIVAFAEVERFVDTPVKHYSSGMYVRLAFAVAAHLEPEILLVDEVLAVGDNSFQKKCLGKMGDVAKQGRTVLFVSHNMGAITQLCSKTIWLDAGKVEMIGASDAVVRRYLSDKKVAVPDIALDARANPSSPMIFTRCWLADPDRIPIAAVDVTAGFLVGLEILIRKPVPDADVAVRVYNSAGQLLFTAVSTGSEVDVRTLSPGKYALFVKVPGAFLAPGTYSLTIAIHRPNISVLDFHEYLLSFRIEESGSPMWQYRGGYGDILVHFPWEYVQLKSED